MIKTWNITIPQLTGKEKRRAYLYRPDGWEEDRTQRYPVLYMFDGHNLFFDDHATYGKSWGLLEYMEYTQTPLIIAAIECNHHPDNGRLSEYCPFPCRVPELGVIHARGKVTMDHMVNVFKPYIDRRWPTLPDRAHTFIAGSSMGGLMTLYAISRYNRVFSRGAALSPSVWFGEDKLDRILRNARYRRDTVLYMDCGEQELARRPNMIRRFQQVGGLLAEKGVLVTSRLIPGGTHTEASWERQIPFFMDTLLYGLED